MIDLLNKHYRGPTKCKALYQDENKCKTTVLQVLTSLVQFVQLLNVHMRFLMPFKFFDTQ